MANSIDFGTLALGALIGVGCRKQLRAASRIAATTAASLAGAAATAVAEVAKETKSPEEQAAAEEAAAAEWTQQVYQRIDQKLAGNQADQNGQG